MMYDGEETFYVVFGLLSFYLSRSIRRFQARSPVTNKRALNSRISSHNEETVIIGIRHLIEFLKIYSVGKEIKNNEIRT